ncbi:DUF262 domain-containing protein [Shewanella sp. 10N.286.45.A1]|uniref:DUF262 domain-containing protein n=1 Tax=Shewanella sp. 10N.286.45.A1 TaxID=3229694 RepID=UPI00355161B7
MKLQSLNDIFERRILRIPDYQRGYAWSKQQLVDFWEDIIQLDPKRVHYTGVITLEPVKSKLWQKWEQDEWIIDGVGFKPFYVVDGQQRLTTSMILIQSIIESIDPNVQLNYQSLESIRKQYILFKADDGQRESFIFGYEKDNPSDEYLKTTIFGEHSHSNLHQETLYTQNLLAAKDYFKEQLAQLDVEDIALIFKKLTQKLKYNLYEIDEEIDVFVTFETMNNRGKPLTSLELLKNRLIYLSTLFHDHEGHDVLRNKVNSAWKTMYEYLGKNPEAPLNENLFLRNHWTMYFKYTRNKGDDYIKYLLNDKFTARNVTHPGKEEDKIIVSEISDYVTSLQESIRHWFYIHNPYFSLMDYKDEQNKLLLDRLQRLSFKAFRPLLLAAFVSKQTVEDINKLLVAAERYNFTLFSLCHRRSNTGDSEFFSMARDLATGTICIDSVIANINSWIDSYYDPQRFLSYIAEKYELGLGGFFKWDGLRYFLYEHDQWLTTRGKQSTNKLGWSDLKATKKDNITIEHIFPQTPDNEYWQARFGHLDNEQTTLIANSLGNLVPLSRAKNSSLQNDGFDDKKNNGSGVGYYNGSSSENEIAQHAEWLPENTLERGLELLEFMEKRWAVSIGDEEFKTKLLHLDFLSRKEELEAVI